MRLPKFMHFCGNHLFTCICSYEPSQADAVVYEAVSKSSVDHSQYGHVLRWFNHIASFGDAAISRYGRIISSQLFY